MFILFLVELSFSFFLQFFFASSSFPFPATKSSIGGDNHNRKFHLVENKIHPKWKIQSSLRRIVYFTKLEVDQEVI